jgi:endonuclease/exonuclease/phosphatase family metal-dependent hydrolase
MKSRSLLSFPLVLLVIMLCASASLAQNATVAAWNLGGFEPIPPARVKRLAKAIHNMKPDIMALTEVNPDSILQDLVDELGNLGDDYTFLFFEQTAHQNIALIFKTSVEVTDDELVLHSDADQSSLRKALKANVRIGNFDFILIAVHMKSSRDATSRQTRTRQARALANFIRNSIDSSSERDVLVVGDYNMIPGEDQVNFSTMSPGPNSNEFLRFISSESLSGQTSHISGCNPLRGNLLDGFAVSRNFTSEFEDGSLRLVRFTDTSIFSSDTGAPLNCVAYKGFISDHFPIVARFKINGDDDD